MATLYLIRHAEPEILGTFLGQSDPPLSEQGHRQAQSALSQLQCETAYVSPLQRALQTAAYLPNAELVVLPQLQEIGFGKWTGKTWDEIEVLWPEIARLKKEDWLGVNPPEGESWSALLGRLRPVWNMIRTKRSTCAVVAHAAVNAALMNLIDGRSAIDFRQSYAEVTAIQYDDR